MSSPAADATDAADAAADLLSLFEGAQPTPQAGAPSAMVAIATTTPAALSNDLTAALVPDAGPIANPPAGRIAGRIWQNMLSDPEAFEKKMCAAAKTFNIYEQVETSHGELAMGSQLKNLGEVFGIMQRKERVDEVYLLISKQPEPSALTIYPVDPAAFPAEASSLESATHRQRTATTKRIAVSGEQ
jgi:hypothetical protein